MTKNLGMKIFDALIFVAVFYTAGYAQEVYNWHKQRAMQPPVQMTVRCVPQDDASLLCGIIFNRTTAVGLKK